MEALLAELGNPERELAAIHIAGTNGKGSVAALCAAVLDGAGLGRVGRFTSPHLLRFNERITVGGQPIGAELEPLLRDIEDAARRTERGRGEAATFFECAAAAAFEHFRRKGVRVAVVETGLGGRLDATNVLIPVVAAITSVGLDHCEYLGDTISAVAGEKAGIIKSGRPVVVGPLAEEALERVVAEAKARGAPLIRAFDRVAVDVAEQSLEGMAARVSSGARSLGKLRLPLAGGFQADNLAVAVATLEAFSDVVGVEIADEAFKSGLERVEWRGRFQLVKRDPPVVVDGAHNPAAARRVAEALHKLVRGRPVGLVAGFCDDKDIAGVLKALSAVAKRGWAVPTPSDRSVAAEAVASQMHQAGLSECQAHGNLASALASAEDWCAAHGGVLLVAGSLFLAGAALQHYGAAGAVAAGEVPDANESLRAL